MVIFIAILSAFAIIGFVSVVKEIIYDDVHTHDITIYTLNNENDIEYIIRSLRNSFPSSEIFVKDMGSEDMTAVIAEKIIKHEA